MNQLAYPLILGCGFLDDHKAVLQFKHDDRTVELTNIQNPSLYLLNTTEVPAYSQKLVECSVDPTILKHTVYSIEPNDELFHHSGLPTAR